MKLRLEKLNINNLSDFDEKTLELIFKDKKFKEYVIINKSDNYNEFIAPNNTVYVTKNATNEIVTLFILGVMVQNGEYDIVYGTNPLYRGCGYTKWGLNLLQKELLQEEIVETLFALVVKENTLSKKLLYSVDFYDEAVSKNATLLRYDLR